MISFVRGTVAHIGATEVVVDVGGVGMALTCTPATSAALHTGSEATLAASLVVREDSLTLFGFSDTDERTVFELLQTASGVGPRLALAVLSVHAPDVVRRALASEDVGTLTTVPGIGKKGAARIVLELKDKVGALTSPPATDEASSVGAGQALPASGGWSEQVHEALLGLGWSARDAERAIATVAAEADNPDQAGTEDVPQLLRAALRTLAR